MRLKRIKKIRTEDIRERAGVTVVNDRKTKTEVWSNNYIKKTGVHREEATYERT